MDHREIFFQVEVAAFVYAPGRGAPTRVFGKVHGRQTEIRPGRALPIDFLSPFVILIEGIESRFFAALSLIRHAESVQDSGADGAVPREPAGGIAAGPDVDAVKRIGQPRSIIIIG